jgi:hypothetical protein
MSLALVGCSASVGVTAVSTTAPGIVGIAPSSLPDTSPVTPVPTTAKKPPPTAPPTTHKPVTTTTTVHVPPAISMQALRNAVVPSLCDNKAGRLVNGSLPKALITVDPNASSPGQVWMRDDLPRIVGDIERDGKFEIIDTVGCGYPSVAYPQGYLSLVIYNDRMGLLGAATIDGVPDSLKADATGVAVAWTTCTPDIDVCVPDKKLKGHLRHTAKGYAIVQDAAASESLQLAKCISVKSMNVGMAGHRPEVALFQTVLKRLGFDPGSVDGYFGANTMSAAMIESHAHSPDTGSEIGVDEGVVLDTMFKRLGIAC